MERRTALWISASVHGAFVLWALVAGWFSADFDEAMEVTEVSLISGADFAALTDRAGGGEPAPGAAAETAPAEAPAPETAAEAAPEAPPEEPAQPGTAPEAAPEAATTVPAAPAPSAVPETSARELSDDPGETPTPAPRVAPRPSDRTDEDVAVAETARQAAEPVPAETAETTAEPQEATAPEAATTRIVTEATDQGGAERIALAPAAAPRPPSRPERRPVPPAPEPAALPEPEPAPPAPGETIEPDAAGGPAPADPTDPLADAIAGAVAEAVEGGGAPDADPGPPMTANERDALRLAVQDCWVVDVGSESANVTVTVGMSMSPEGRVVDGTLRRISSQGGSDAAADAAFQAARRAILRCQGDGYDLPAEKYPQWQEIEMVFNPSEMRVR